MRPIIVCLTACSVLSGDLLAQNAASSRPLTPAIVQPSFEVPPELAARLAAQAGQPAPPPRPGQPNQGGQRTPEQERTQMLQQLTIDRSPSGILQARLQAARGSDDPKFQEEGQPPADQPPVEEVEPPADPSQVNPAQQKQLEDQKKRQQYQQDVAQLRLHVTLGNWGEVRTFLESLPPNDSRVAFQRILAQLNSKVTVNPRPELAVLGAKSHPQDQYLRPEELLALSDASPQAPDRNALKQLAGLLPKNVPPPPSFLAALRNGTRYLGSADLDTRGRTVEFLLNADLLAEAAEFLPSVEDVREAGNHATLNLLARFHAAAHLADRGASHLPTAWSLCLEVLGTDTAALPVRAEALYRMLSLVPELDEEAGSAWLDNTFTDPQGEGFEILAAVGTLSAQGRQLPNAEARLENLRLQAAAAKALLETEGIDLAAWAEVLTVYALNWIYEAEFARQRDQTTSRGPVMQVDRFGNPYYVETTTRYEGAGLPPVSAADLLDCHPDGKWLELVDEPVRLDCLAALASLYLKVQEESSAFPVLQQLAGPRPKQAEDLVRNMITVWARNHNPNQASRYRSSYYYYYGVNRRAETIPLTRSKQERNLVELAELVTQVRSLELEASFDEELTDAFIQAHSQAEVWRLEALASVFGDLDQLEAETLAVLLSRMRTNLATLWPDPKLQEDYQTKRRDKELVQHIVKGYAAARELARNALARHPGNWRLQVQQASLEYEESNYQSSLTPQADHSITKRKCLDALAAAAAGYAATLPLDDESEESTDAFETWFYAALGSPDLGALKAHHQPVPAEYARIGEALSALPADAADRHLARFANTLNNRLANVSPDLKYRYLAAAREVVGDHERLKSALDVFQYYQDLVTEIELVTRIDGPDVINPDVPFGLFVNLRHTSEIERESGGFQRYLQNQNSTSYSYNYGRPTEDYRDKFEKAARAVLDEHFEVLSLTFHESKIESRSDPVFGWRVTPYAYFLLKARGPQVDQIPPLTIDLDFLDTSGYVVLPVSSSALSVDAGGAASPRPVRDLKVALTLDERSAAEEGNLFLDVKATGHGLVPPLEALLDLPPANFEVVDTEDRSLLIEQLDPETEDGAPLSTHEWRLKLATTSDSAPQTFTFPPVLVETAAEEGLTLQRYVDVDLVPVPATVELGAKVGPRLPVVLLLLGGVVIVLIGAGIWMALRRSSTPPETSEAPSPPSTLTPVTLLAFLEKLHTHGHLTPDREAALAEEIEALQHQFFGPAADGPSRPDLRQIIKRWQTAT